MGKLLLGILIGALLMSATGKWRRGDLSASQRVAAVRDAGLDAGQAPGSVLR